MPITLTCPHCGQTVAVEATPGQQVRCGSCNTVFLMPGIGAHASEAPVTTLDYATPTAAPRKGLAITSLVVGIVAIPADCVLIGPLLGIAAIVLGIGALVRANARPGEHGGKGMAIAGMCCGGVSILLIIPLMLSILLPSLSRARELAKRAVCASQLRGIGQSCLIYADDNNGEFPSDLRLLIDAGLVAPGELQCPSEGNDSEAKPDYVLVAGFRGSPQVDWIVAYEDPANHGGEGGNILYIDNHVEFLKEPAFSKELERVRKELEAAAQGEEP